MKKSYLFFAVMLLICSLLSFSLLASADDDYHRKDDYDEYDEYKDYKRYDHDDHHEHGDDDEDYDEDYVKDQSETIVTKEFWYKWSRSAAKPVEIEQLPITESSTTSLVVDNRQPVQTEIIPNGSQVMVPVEEVAKMLGAEVTIYPDSEIIEINNDKKQLIVRNNSKVVYENMRKTPMQEAVLKQNGKYFISISVLANGLGYEINEQVEKNQIQLERVVQL